MQMSHYNQLSSTYIVVKVIIYTISLSKFSNTTVMQNPLWLKYVIYQQIGQRSMEVK